MSRKSIAVDRKEYRPFTATFSAGRMSEIKRSNLPTGFTNRPNINLQDISKPNHWNANPIAVRIVRLASAQGIGLFERGLVHGDHDLLL